MSPNLTTQYLQQIMKMETQANQCNKTIKEGQAEICLTSEKVFYNPVQEFNRDLSIAVLSVFTEEFKAEIQALNEQKNRKRDKSKEVEECEKCEVT